MQFERHHSALILSSVFTVASFVGATAYTQNRLMRLDALSSTIETNAVSSIDYLSQAAVRLTRLNQLLDEIALDGTRRGAAIESARQEVGALDSEVQQYVLLPPLPGERDFWAALRTHVEDAVKAIRDSVDPEGQAVPRPADLDAADAAIDRALQSVLVTLDFDVKASKAIARDVRNGRAGTLRMVVSLDAAATVVAMFGLFIAYRASLRHDELTREHNSLLASRVHELDRFAGRVAHDVLSPLGTIATGLALLSQTGDDRAHSYIERSQRALQRVRELVDGLLMFARAGARPDAGVHCAVDTVLKNVLADCSDMAAERGVELIVTADPSLEVPCSVGVGTSVIENLVRNAIKYMGDRQVRRVAVRVKRAGARVRFEVEDTGPGIDPPLQARMFEPFVRGPSDGVAGSGLGLATVKRLVESHGGTIAVESNVGVGTRFRVDLPTPAADDIRAVHAS